MVPGAPKKSKKSQIHAAANPANDDIAKKLDFYGKNPAKVDIAKQLPTQGNKNEVENDARADSTELKQAEDVFCQPEDALPVDMQTNDSQPTDGTRVLGDLLDPQPIEPRTHVDGQSGIPDAQGQLDAE